MTGCMPDSMTKFKKDEPKKAANTDNVPVVDEEGNVVDTSEFINPTTFKYRYDLGTTQISEAFVSEGSNLALSPILDGSVGLSSMVSKTFLNCTISPALPGGLSIDKSATTEACKITGKPIAISTDPLNPGKPINYTITLSYIKKGGSVGTISTSLAIGVYSPVIDFSYTQNEKILFTVGVNSGTLNTATTSTNVDIPYLRTGFVTSESGTIGVIKFIDTINSKIGVAKLVPLRVTNLASLGLPATEYVGLLAPKFISAAGGKSAKVIRVSAATSTIYVEMLSSAMFNAGDALDNEKNFVSNSGTVVAELIENYSFARINNIISLDNNIQYFSDKYIVTIISRAYEVNKTFGVDHSRLLVQTRFPYTLVPENGARFTVAPQLPDGLVLNESTGEISGAFADVVDPTTYVVTATNRISNYSVNLNLSAIKKPNDLSYTTRQLMAVKNTTKFIEAEKIIRPMTPPLTVTIVGNILKKFDSGAAAGDNRYKLSVDTISGSFAAASSLDSGNFFYSEKSFVPATAIAPVASTPATTPIIVNYNLAIEVISTSGFTIGGYASTSQGSLARIVAIEGNTLFVQTIANSDPAVIVPFQERSGMAANIIGNQAVFADSTSTTSITQLESNIVDIKRGSTTGSPVFAPGKDITSSGDLAGYIYSISSTDPTIVSASNITRKPGSTATFKYNQNLFADESVELVPTNYSVIENVYSKPNIYVLEVGKYSEIQSNISSGNSISYSITPPLPTGLTFDPKTGLISGTPSIRTTMKDYLITATNLIGKSAFPIELEIRDYFRITDGSGASTSIMHKYGSFKNNRECKINATDIVEGDGDLDVRCILDIEEEELHNTRLKFLSSAGAGICEFVEVEPFSFWSFSPIRTPPSTVVNIRPTCVAAGVNGVPADAVLTAPRCAGNYEPLGGPNCDSGTYTLITYAGSDANSDGDCADPGEISAATPVTIQCNGRKINCLDGPVTDILTPTELAQGYRSTITSTFSGGTVSTQLMSPFQKLHASNLRVANGTINNQCSLSNDEADTWESYTSGESENAMPFGNTSPFYTFNCLDGARDIKARVRLVVREWNKTFKVNSFIDVDLPGAAPYAEDLMNNAAPVFGKSNNDYNDWDDAYGGPGTAANYGTCGASMTAPYLYPEDAL